MRVTINTRVLAGVLPVLGLMLLVASALAAPAPVEPHRVLVLHSFRNSLPMNTDWYNGLVRGFDSAPDLQIEIDIEAPDLTRFNDADYVSDLLDIYRRKYRDQKPQLIIPTYTPALQFLLDYGEDLFPGIPIVFCGADRRFVARQELAPHITGITSHRDFAGTLELALQLHPDTRRVAVIVGFGDLDKQFERAARQAFQPFEDRVEFIWLQGLPLAELTEAVKELPVQTVIMYLVQLQDRTGKTYVPLNTVKTLSTVAHAPICGLWDTLLGGGIIGGRLATVEEDGFQAAQMGLRILGGETPAAVPIVDRQRNRAIFDGRELARWNIGEDQLPAGSRIAHHQLSFWDKHWTKITITGLVIGIQGAFILVLLLNRARLKRAKAALQDECDRREHSELVTSKLRARLGKFSKERTLGAMTTGIAHEINQPLIAIQNYTQAAKRYLQSGGDRMMPKLDELLEKVEQQAGRAGDIIQHIRTLVSTNDVNLLPVSLYSVVEQVIQIMGPRLRSQGCSVDCKPATDLPAVLADELQLQLVLVNLLQNTVQSMEAMEDSPDKVISIEMHEINDREVQVGVADRGPGITPDRVDDVFEPFLSDKADGMGIGLAVCRDIIEAHGGRIWYTPNPSGGAIFRFTLRRAAE